MKQLKVLSATQGEERKLEKLLRRCKDAYYLKSDEYVCPREELPAEFVTKYASRLGRLKYVPITDYLFDKLEALMKVWNPNNPVLKLVGPSSDKTIKNKVKLPFYMGSMDKIEPGGGAVDKWKKAHPGPYVLMDKADGLSLLTKFSKGGTNAYTRGKDGKTGGDVSFLVPHLRIPVYKGELAVRGEVIMKPEVFKAKYARLQKNPRNMASGLLNRQSVDTAHKDLNVIMFEVLNPRMKPSAGLAFLKAKGFKVMPHKVVKDISEESLRSALADRISKSKYEIDGLVIYQDRVNSLNTSGNPGWAVAFKDAGGQESAQATVIAIEWEITRHGYLAPRIKIKPIQLRGVTINYASGKNAGFLKANRVGPGAVVRIRRAGDVIPDLADGDVIKGATPTWPDRKKFGDWEWTDSGVNIKIKGKQHLQNDTAMAKVIEHFFTSIGVEGFKESTIQKFVDQGYRSVGSILAMSERRFTSLDGTTKTIHKVYQDIQTQIDGVELPMLMDASNIFGRGMGTTRLRVIVKAYPQVMKQAGDDVSKLATQIMGLPGFSDITANQFASNLKRFAKWLKSVPSISYSLPKAKKATGAKCVGVSAIMTGFRDKEVADQIEREGGKMVTTVRQATHLIAKDPTAANAKLTQARGLGIKVMSLEEFKRKFRL